MVSVFIFLFLILCSLSLSQSQRLNVAQPIKIGCIGDSITVGTDCSQDEIGYPGRLQKLLGDENQFLVKNFGSDGHTMMTDGLCGPPAEGNCSYVSTQQWIDARQFEADIYTIMLGTNDAKEFNWFGVQNGDKNDNFVLDYLNFINDLYYQKAKKPKIFIMSLVPLYSPFPYEMNSTIINYSLSDPKTGLIKQIANLNKNIQVSFIDIHSAFVNMGFGSEITCDGCHPVGEGYELIAQTMYPPIIQYINNVIN